MKTYSFDKEELEYLKPIEAVRNALDTQIKAYILNRVYTRLGIKMEQRSHYNIPQGTIDIEEVIVVKELPKDGPTKRNKSV